MVVLTVIALNLEILCLWVVASDSLLALFFVDLILLKVSRSRKPTSSRRIEMMVIMIMIIESVP